MDPCRGLTAEERDLITRALKFTADECLHRSRLLAAAGVSPASDYDIGAMREDMLALIPRFQTPLADPETV